MMSSAPDSFPSHAILCQRPGQFTPARFFARKTLTCNMPRARRAPCHDFSLDMTNEISMVASTLLSFQIVGRKRPWVDRHCAQEICGGVAVDSS